MSVLKNEGRLLTALALIVVLMNVPYGSYLLYPFELFSTWVHEMSHGLMAILVGGEIDSLKVFYDGSGLATTRYPRGRLNSAAVSSAGYLGTALFGGLLLAARRFPKIGRTGTTLIGATMLLSTLLWVRNGFGLVSIPLMGFALLAAGRRLSEERAGFLFALLAATCSLNSLTSIRVLFSGSTFQVGGQAVRHSDAHSVAEQLMLPAGFWAGSWMLLSFVLLFLGLRLGSRGES